MTAKEISFDIEARNRMLAGVDILARAVGVTLGPRGRNVVLERGGATPQITKNGDTVARVFDLEDRFQNLGAQIVKEVAARTNSEAGDGTSTATVLAQAVIHEGVKLIAVGANPMDVKRGIDRAAKATVAALHASARPVNGQDNIARVGTVSANGDTDIGAQIAEAMERVGRDGIITVADNPGYASEIEIVEGLQFLNGYLSPHFVTDPEKALVILDDAHILLHDGKLSSLQPLLPILEAVNQSGRQLLIIAEDVEGEALSALVVNKVRGGLTVAAVKAPGFGDRRKAMLDDIAAVTGGQLVSHDRGMTLEAAGIEVLGHARRVEITRETTTLVGGSGDTARIAARIAQVRHQLHDAPSGREAGALRERLSKLAGGVAILHVGGVSEAEVRERKDRVEDALNATRAAVEEGVTVGGGVALVRAGRILDDLNGNNHDENAGIALVRRALSAPLIQIANNAGFDGTFVIEKVRDAEMDSFGFDAAQGDYGDLMERGVIDPVKVVRIALENACSVAGTMITAQVAIAAAASEDEGTHVV
ncbi:chaperonin GroEL [Sinisalibacter lacisalsi]|uniref:Chaperonin GroEL n=1 Tax=Sinisalibacter lacisalsi TaxID=1526570 RepID=A0ABQ1QRE0_9RHOB|nr:chaperonin GroEL [Sinisalibacter lacisalsi]GGD42201.1 60 kDa chaperonin 1 [Sinisalibacter lacisalsi]